MRGTVRVLEQTDTPPLADRPPLAVVDIFCGVGGLTHGFVREGIKVVAGLDNDSSCRHAYEHNNRARFIHASVEEISAADISALYPDGCLKVLARVHGGLRCIGG